MKNVGPFFKAFQTLFFLIPLLFTTVSVYAQVDARLLRQPDVSETQITFVYGGDVWVAPKEGGTAHLLASPPGAESFPRFSPDGSQIAFTAVYAGNQDIYRLPAGGGQVFRVTHHPMGDRMLGWLQEGESILYASSMHSGRQRYSQFYKVDNNGGLPERLPVPYGEFGAVSPDGKWMAYTPMSQYFRTWKRYRGGWAPDIWLFNLETYESRRLTENPANDEQPMWHGQTLYFLSDRGDENRYNMWAYNLDDDSFRQVTHFEQYDIQSPAIGPADIVFHLGPQLYIMDLATETPEPLDIKVYTDRSTLRAHTEQVSDLIMNADISPAGERAVFGARGEVFTVPAEHGPVLNLTQTTGIAERKPVWSPDETLIAYWTDRGGEYQLAVRPVGEETIAAEERILTEFESGFRYRPQWSPDSRKLAFIDQLQQIQIYNRDTDEITTIDSGLWMTHGGLENFSVSWSPDSRWLAYSRGMENRNGVIFIYDTENGELHQVTSGFYHNSQPVFGSDGKYLFFLTNRSFDPVYGDVDNSWVYANSTKIAFITLRNDVASPLAPRVDQVKGDSTEQTQNQKKGGEEKEPASIEIDFENIERRIVELPVEAGNMTHLSAAPGKVLYRRFPASGSENNETPLLYFDLKERAEKTVLKDISGYMLSANHKKLLVAKDDKFYIIGLGPNKKLNQPLATGKMTMHVQPEEEWNQLFYDAWRFYRDYFYDPNMHGVDWEAVRENYQPVLEDAITRRGVNFVIGQMIAELNASHTYRGGGDLAPQPQRGGGLLGVNWSIDNGAYRIDEILRAAPWVSEVRSPLDRPGLQVEEGDYVLAVNGRRLTTDKDPWATLEGLNNQTVLLTINDEPSMEGARRIAVQTLSVGEDTRLRHLAWIQKNRKRVSEATNGRVGYIYVPDTGVDGQNELVRQFQAQFDKAGLIIDERFNSGGQIPDRFVELLNRPVLSYWAVRSGKDWQWPPVAHFGPQAMLINGWSGSGGDAFPYYFKEAGRGPLIGMRTWGGLIGISGVPPLIDGGGVTVPSFRMYSADGAWFPEGHGVEPDIKVIDDPTKLAQGIDPQLERAIDWVMNRLAENPPAEKPPRPDYEDRSGN